MAEAQKRPRLNFVELAKTPITILLEHYSIVLTPTKSGLRGDCPFPIHTGGKGTFGVNLQGNYFQCFSPECQKARGGRKGGNVIGFVQAMQGIAEYYDAAVQLQAIVSARSEAEKKPEKAVQSEVVEKTAEVVQLRPMQQLEIELRELLRFPSFEGETFGQFQERVIKSLKVKFRENYLKGKADGSRAQAS